MKYPQSDPPPPHRLTSPQEVKLPFWKEFLLGDFMHGHSTRPIFRYKMLERLRDEKHIFETNQTCFMKL